jgi:hypothetical protein
MHIRRTAATIAVLACTLAACSSNESSDKADTKPTATEKQLTQAQKDAISAAAGMPPRPTGEKRQQLLDALKQAAPDVVRYDDKAVDAARNQCSAINGGGNKLDYLASQRFTYKDVTTSEAQGAQINKALKDLGFCKV